MTFNKNTAAAATVILINLVIWPVIIIPGIVGIIKDAGQNKKALSEKTDVEFRDSVGSSPVTNYIMIRDPFRYQLEQRAPYQNKKTIPQSKTNRAADQKPAGPSDGSGPYVSKFRLKSIVQSKNQFIASLEEVPHYGNVQNAVAPYSYRFGSQPETPETKTCLVSEGDTLQDEKIIKIRENYVILFKNGAYYRLTFSGGSPVEKP